MGSPKGGTPDVPEPGPPPKPEQTVDSAFREARSRTRRKPQRSLTGTDITGGLLSNALIGKKQLLGE